MAIALTYERTNAIEGNPDLYCRAVHAEERKRAAAADHPEPRRTATTRSSSRPVPGRLPEVLKTEHRASEDFRRVLRCRSVNSL